MKLVKKRIIGFTLELNLAIQFPSSRIIIFGVSCPEFIKKNKGRKKINTHYDKMSQIILIIAKRIANRGMIKSIEGSYLVKNLIVKRPFWK